MRSHNHEAKDNEERGRAIVQTLAVVVESMVQPSESVPSAYTTRTKFEAFRAPGISIRDYLLRIHKYANCSPECFVLALVYIDRLHEYQGLILTELNVHRVLITSVVLAAKFFDDHYFNNAYYAKVGGVPCSEMNELELEFLLMINFTLHVSTDIYARYFHELANHYVFTTIRNSRSRHKFCNQVVMDPEQDGQLIYVPGADTEPGAEHVYSQQYQYDHQQHLQPAPVYAYQQQASSGFAYEQQQSGYGNHHQHVKQDVHSSDRQPVYAYQRDNHQTEGQVVHAEQHRHEEIQRQQHAPHPVYAYQREHDQTQGQHHQSMYGYQQPLPHGGSANPYVSQTGPPLHPQFRRDQAQAPSNSAQHHTSRSSKDDGVVSRVSSNAVPSTVNGKYVGTPVTNAASTSSASSNGIVYGSSGRTSGQKRSQSVALGVNA